MDAAAASVTLLRADGPDSAPNPCPVPLSSYPLWTARSEPGGEYGELDIACANGQLARTNDFPNTPFTIHDLDSSIVWIGDFQIATEHSWYYDYTLERYGVQGPLEEGERVFGYTDGTRVGMRMSSLGIARSILTVPLEE